MAISKEQIDEIKSKINIVDLIGQYVPLTKKGQNYWGLCPFHADKHPSFSVNEKRGIYHCWSGSCGKAGDVIRFLEDYKNESFTEALQEVAEQAGVALNIESNKPERENPNAKLYEINNQASYLYENYLLITEQGKEARDYLAGRQIDEKLAKVFNIGLAPDMPDFLYKNLVNKFDEKDLARVGLFNYGKAQIFDSFQNRLIFPIHNQFGQTIAFSGRIWQKDDDRQGKYVNTATTPIFEKSNVLYNLHRAKKSIMRTKEVYLMEGYMDVIAAYRAEVENVVAIMGTALTESHVRQLSKMADKLILITDGDKAGQTAIQKGLSAIKGIALEVVVVPESMDPDEYEKKYGPEALKRLMEDSRMTRVEYLMQSLKPANLSNLTNQIEFLQTMATIIAEESDERLKESYIRRLADLLPDFNYQQIETSVQEVAKGQASFQNTNQTSSQAVAPGYDDGYYDSFDNYDYQNQPNYPEGNSDYPQSSPNFGPMSVEQIQVQATRKLTRSERIERQLLYVMIKRPSLIEKLSSELNIKFQNANTSEIYEKLIVDFLVEGFIDENAFAEKLNDQEKNLYFEILDSDMPDELTDEELELLLKGLKQEALLQQVKDLSTQSLQAQKESNRLKELELSQKIFKLRQQLQRGEF